MAILTCASYKGQDSVGQGIHYESTQVNSYMYNDSVLYRGTVYGSTGTIGNRLGSYRAWCAHTGREERGWGDRLSPAPIKDRQAVDGGDQRLRETVGDCEPDRLERERELLALLSQVVLWACVSKDAIGLRTNARCERT